MTDRPNTGQSSEIMEIAGISYRQLDYWTTLGHLIATDANPGSGARREWAPIELDIARMIGRLRDADIPLGLAARVARDYVMTQLVDQLVEQPDQVTPIEIAPGILIVIEEIRDDC